MTPEPAGSDAHIVALARGGLVLGVAALVMAGTASPALARIEFRKDRLAQPRGQAPPVAELLVQFRRDTDEARREGIARDAGGRVALRLRLVRALAVAPREGTGLEELRARLLASDRVQRVEDDGPIAIAKSANDPGVSEQYAIKQKDDHDIDAPGAWTERTDCAKVAVLDTGVQTDHPDLKKNLWENTKDPNNGRDDDNNGVVDDRYGGDIVDGKGSGDDKHGHGTHVAGIIGARGNNDRGITGLCWSMKIVAVRVMDADGHGTWSREIAGIDYAIKAGAKVINASYGGSTGSDIVRDAIGRARDKGVLVVAAAGNDGEQRRQAAEVPGRLSGQQHPVRRRDEQQGQARLVLQLRRQDGRPGRPRRPHRLHVLEVRLRVHVGHEHGDAVRGRRRRDAAQAAFLLGLRRHQRPPAQDRRRAQGAEGQDRLRQAPEHRQGAGIVLANPPNGMM